jgi:hypothetical protein
MDFQILQFVPKIIDVTLPAFHAHVKMAQSIGRFN